MEQNSRNNSFVDLAAAKNSHLWLRHPVLGDPSFDTFEKLSLVHSSEPPFEWAVNGSLFRDPKDGSWYCYVGLYPINYSFINDNSKRFEIYKSEDEGKNWTNVGCGFIPGFVFSHTDCPADNTPDVVITYDEQEDKYWLAYDFNTNSTDWTNLFEPTLPHVDSGAALAWAETPAGPFHRMEDCIYSNARSRRELGRFLRGYATTVMKRKDDWIAFILMDSGKYYSWGLACITASSPEGPWSPPVVLLSVDRPGYYPAPVEFHPCHQVGDMVYAPATSLGASRNYQAVFCADIEKAHIPSSWNLCNDGNVWHSRNDPDEIFGIWGQTYHGFVHDGQFNVMYPARDIRGFGTISIASRPWDQPVSDGFSFSAHRKPCAVPTLCAYSDFELNADIIVSGTVEIGFNYCGILGPNAAEVECWPHRQTLSGYTAVRFSEGELSLVTVSQYVAADDSQSTSENVHFAKKLPDGFSGGQLTLIYKSDTAEVYLNSIFQGSAEIQCDRPRPLVLAAGSFSYLTCSRFEVRGNQERYSLRYSGLDALLGAGQCVDDWKAAHSNQVRGISETLLYGKGNVKAKWNVIGDSFTIYAPKSPELGQMMVAVDGYCVGTVVLYSEHSEASSAVYTMKGLEQGRHSILLTAFEGEIAIDAIEVAGMFKKDRGREYDFF